MYVKFYLIASFSYNVPPLSTTTFLFMTMFMITLSVMSVVLDSDDQGKNSHYCPNKSKYWVMHDFVNPTLVMMFLNGIGNQEH